MYLLTGIQSRIISAIYWKLTNLLHVSLGIIVRKSIWQWFLQWLRKLQNNNNFQWRPILITLLYSFETQRKTCKNPARFCLVPLGTRRFRFLRGPHRWMLANHFHACVCVCCRSARINRRDWFHRINRTPRTSWSHRLHRIHWSYWRYWYVRAQTDGRANGRARSVMRPVRTTS